MFKIGQIKWLKSRGNPPLIYRMIRSKKDVEKKAESFRTVEYSNITNPDSFPSIFVRKVQVWPRYPHRRAPLLCVKLVIVNIIVGSDIGLNTGFSIARSYQTPWVGVWSE